MEQQSPTMQFGKYQGRKIRDVPLSYLRWWKAELTDRLRECGTEIDRREEMGLTETIELKLGKLHSHIRENLLERLESCLDADERETVLGLIETKFQEYSIV